jgi:hypothetical protein
MRRYINSEDPAAKQFLIQQHIPLPPSVLQIKRQADAQKRVDKTQHKHMVDIVTAPPPPSHPFTLLNQQKPVVVVESAPTNSEYVTGTSLSRKGVATDTTTSTTFMDRLYVSMYMPATWATASAGFVLGYLSTDGSVPYRVAMGGAGAAIPVVTLAAFNVQ